MYLLIIGYNVSFISVDFPLPETPVTQIIFPKRIVKSTFLRLLPVAPFKTIFLPLPFLLFLGMSNPLVPFR